MANPPNGCAIRTSTAVCEIPGKKTVAWRKTGGLVVSTFVCLGGCKKYACVLLSSRHEIPTSRHRTLSLELLCGGCAANTTLLLKCKGLTVPASFRAEVAFLLWKDLTIRSGCPFNFLGSMCLTARRSAAFAQSWSYEAENPEDLGKQASSP